MMLKEPLYMIKIFLRSFLFPYFQSFFAGVPFHLSLEFYAHTAITIKDEPYTSSARISARSCACTGSQIGLYFYGVKLLLFEVIARQILGLLCCINYFYCGIVRALALFYRLQ